MKAGNFDIIIYLGVSYARNIYLKQPDGETAEDLTGWQVAAQARAKVESGDVLCNLAPAITDAEAGKIEIALTGMQTAAIAKVVASGVWDLILTRPDGARVGPFLAGTFTTRRPVTR